MSLLNHCHGEKRCVIMNLFSKLMSLYGYLFLWLPVFALQGSSDVEPPPHIPTRGQSGFTTQTTQWQDQIKWLASLSMCRHICFLLSFSNSCVSTPAYLPTASMEECSLRSSMTFGNWLSWLCRITHLC